MRVIICQFNCGMNQFFLFKALYLDKMTTSHSDAAGGHTCKLKNLIRHLCTPERWSWFSRLFIKWFEGSLSAGLSATAEVASWPQSPKKSLRYLMRLKSPHAAPRVAMTIHKPCLCLTPWRANLADSLQEPPRMVGALELESPYCHFLTYTQASDSTSVKQG